MRRRALVLLLLLLMAWVPGRCAAEELARGASTVSATQPSIVRTPQWPLKDKRRLFSDEAIHQVRENIAKYPSAKAVAEQWMKTADEWVQWDDEKLAGLIASAAVPRDWGIAADPNCPECGKPIGDPNNRPGWIVDPHKPFKTTCPLCGATFPSNDFETYYRSGFKTKIGWDTKYVDDGWGWTNPKNGQKYWFVAFANHWTMHGKLYPVMHALGRAYLFTGDKRYAHKALVLLHAYAAVYPEMDYESQSRYGLLMRAQGQHYRGKIAYDTWETDLVTALAECYDACWDAVDTDAELQKETAKTGQQIRAFIEANLLEDAIDAYFQGKIRGNFGMHQSTLAHLGIVREYGEQEKWYDLLMNESSPNYQLLGLNFALYNVVYRDGFSLETSSHYNSIWVRKISEYASMLEKCGRKPFDIPKLERIYDAVLAVICIRAHDPSIGDGGSVYGGIFPHDPESFQTAYRHYHDPRYLRYVTAMYGPPKDGGFNSFESLFHPPPQWPQELRKGPTTHPAQPSRLLDGYGMGIINNAADSVGASLYYGLIHSHGHYDRLHFELFASGQPMMPDLGYPDGANDFVPGIHTWSKNTVAHNTVVVDASRQPNNVPGAVELFASGKFARVMDITASGTYPQCDQYRRAMIQVDVDPKQSYFVDFFTVSGGHQHDYSLHGPPGEFETIGGQWSEPGPGTLAGENVKLEEIYDDPKLGTPGYKGGYSSYHGSGFQHIYNVRRNQGGETIAQWSHEKDPAAKLRIRVLDQPDQELILGNAHVSPIKHPEVLTYLIARRKTESGKLASRFVSVIEPYSGEPVIKSARRIGLKGAGTAVEVTRSNGETELIIYDGAATKKDLPELGVSTDAQVVVIRRSADKRLLGRFFAGGSFLAVGDDRLQGMSSGGAVVSVDPSKSQIRVKPEQPGINLEQYVGRVVHFRNDLRRTAHTVIEAKSDGDEILLTTADDLLVGRARVDAAEADALTTSTSLPLAPIYRGVTLGSATFAPLARVRGVGAGKISLATPIAQEHRPAPGQDVWLINVGPADTFELPALVDVSP